MSKAVLRIIVLMVNTKLISINIKIEKKKHKCK